MGFTIWAEATARDINALLTLHKVHPQVRADVKRRLNALVEKSYEELESLQPCYNESPENICGAIAEDIFRRTIDVAIPLAQLRDEERKCSELQQELSDLRLSAKKANDRCGHTEAVLIDLKQAHDYMLHSYFREVLILRHRVDELQRRGSGAPSPPTRSKTRGFPQYRRATDSSRDQTQRQTTFGDAIQIAEKSDSDDRANSDDAPSSPRKSEGTNHPDSEAQIVNSLGPYAKYFQQNGISDAKSMLQCIAAKYEESIDAIFDYERYLGILNKSAGSWEDRYNAVCEENEELSQQLEKERAKTRSMRYADMDRDETISFLERKLEDARLLTEKYQLYLHLATGPVRVQLTDLLDEIRNEVGIMRAEHLRQMSLVKDAMVELQNRSEALLDFFLTYVQGAGEIIHNIKLDAAAKTLDELNSIPVASTTKVMSFFAIQDSGHRMKWSKKIVGAQPDFNEDPDAFYSTDGLSFWSYHPITRSAFSTFSELHDLVEKLRKRKAHAISQGSLLKGKKARDASYDYGDDYHVPAGVDVPATRSGTSVVSTADAPAGLSSDIPRTAAEPTPAGTTTTTDSSASRPQSKNAVANRADSSAAAGKAEPSLPATLLSEKESVDRHRTPSAGLGSSTASKQLPARDSLELYARTNSSSSRRVGGTPSTALRISPAGEWKQKNVDGANGMTGSDILKELVHLRLRRAVNNKRLAHCSNCVNLVELPMNAEFRERLQTVADTIDKRIVEDSERIAELLGLLQSHMDKFNQQRRDAIQQALEARKREDEERKEEARRLLECKTAMEQARASFFTPYLHSPTKKKCVSFDNKGDLLGGYVIFNGELVPISSFFLERAKWDTEEPDAPSHPQYVRGQGRTPYAAVMDYCTGVQLGMPMGSTRGPVYLEHDPETSNFFVADEKGKNILLEASKNHEEHEAVRLPPSEGVMPLTQIIVPAPMPLIDRHARNADTQMAAMNALMSDGYLFYYDPDAPKTVGTWQPRSFPDVLEPVYLVPMCNPVIQEETADMHPKEQLCDSDVYTTSSAPIPLSSATNTLIGSSYSYGLPPRVCRPYANEPMLQIRALGAPGYDAQGERQPHPPSHEVNTEGTIGGFSSALARAKLLRTARLLKEEQDQTEDRERRKEDWQQRMQYQEPTKKEKYLRLRLPRIASSFPDPSETAKLQQKLWPQSSKKRLDSHSEQRVDGAEP